MDVKFKRNIAIVGHARCGKTSLSESLIFKCGASSRKGDVMKGNTISDFNDDEIERNISINASFLNGSFNNHQLQIIDTPGYMDFVGETVAAINVTDAAIIVVDAVNGVEVGTEDVWERLKNKSIPSIIFINKSDKEDAKVDETISSIKEILSKNALQIDFESSELVEVVAESDDELIEKYLETGSLSKKEVVNALRKSVISGHLTPIIVGNCISDDGVEELLKMIIAYLPTPLERPGFPLKSDEKNEDVEIIEPTVDGPFLGLVFKCMFDPHLGQLSLMRIIKGTLTANSDFYNATASSKEHVSSINILQGKEQKSLPQATCGDIVALPKLKNAHVSDSFCEPKNKIVLAPIVFPEPCISASIKPKSRADEEKISSSLHRLCEEDHTVRVIRDNETNEQIISGIGDLHLKIILDRMKRRYNLDVELGKPKVSYRETITKPARARHKYKKQSGGKGQYGDVDLEIKPAAPDAPEFEFINKIFGGAIPKNYIPSVEKGVRQAISEGVLANSLIINIEVKLVDGSYHDVDSSDMAFQIAGAKALKDAIKLAGPVLLEPIMEVSITVPDEFIGPISGDISSRRGRIMGSEAKGKNQNIKAQIPLGEMFQYATDLRSMTGGRGSYTMKFTHYEPAPAKVTAQVVAERKTEKQN